MLVEDADHAGCIVVVYPTLDRHVLSPDLPGPLRGIALSGAYQIEG